MNQPRTNTKEHENHLDFISCFFVYVRGEKSYENLQNRTHRNENAARSFF
jgi:hypothetical protein